ncbi:MAG TPA: hypothetical protein VFV86_00310 [Nitrososphaeraceae archaeon]|nr:hypothetical protein [Nitrososphaeraceae archaeon]
MAFRILKKHANNLNYNIGCISTPPFFNLFIEGHLVIVYQDLITLPLGRL